MPVCKRCHKIFSGLHYEKGCRIELYKRKTCLSCVPFTGNTSQPQKERKVLICETCGRSYKNLPGSSTNKQCRNCMVNGKRFTVKIRAVTYKGGSCKKCGYSSCLEALTFHHKNPSQKDFSISGAHCRSWSKIQEELDKCELLCNRCHAELHAGLWSL